MRRLLVTVLWVVVTGFATLATWQGVRAVGEDITRREAPVLGAAGTDRPEAPPVAAVPPTTAAASDAPPTVPSTTPGTAVLPTAPVTTRPPSTVATGRAAMPSNAPTVAPAVAPSGAAGPAAPAGEERTITSQGGTVAVRYEAGGVELLYARPAPGFETRIARQEPDRVEVEFRGSDHLSRIRARYDAGRPAHDVNESGG